MSRPRRKNLGGGISLVDAMRRTGCGQILVGEEIGANRLVAAPQSRKRRGADARTQDQDVVRQRI